MSVTEPDAIKIGRGWVIAIAALLVLLILGIVLYLRMSAPLRQQPKRPVTVSGAYPGITPSASDQA